MVVGDGDPLSRCQIRHYFSHSNPYVYGSNCLLRILDTRKMAFGVFPESDSGGDRRVQSMSAGDGHAMGIYLAGIHHCGPAPHKRRAVFQAYGKSIRRRNIVPNAAKK